MAFYLRVPPPLALAVRALAEAQRCQLAAKHNFEYAQAEVAMYAARVARLRRDILDLSQEDPSQPPK